MSRWPRVAEERIDLHRVFSLRGFVGGRLKGTAILRLERIVLPTTLHHMCMFMKSLRCNATVDNSETTSLMDCGSEGGYMQPDHTFMHDSVSRVKAYKRSIPDPSHCRSMKSIRADETPLGILSCTIISYPPQLTSSFPPIQMISGYGHACRCRRVLRKSVRAATAHKEMTGIHIRLQKVNACPSSVPWSKKVCARHAQTWRSKSHLSR